MVARSRRIDRAVLRMPHYELAICAIFREEAPFLEEWLTFHENVGASHFYLYNNFSTDDYETVLRPWVARGLVTLYDWPLPVGQLPAYRHCIRNHRRDARWIAFIDIDEFLFSPDAMDVRPSLRAWTQAPAVLVYGFYFGSSGHVTRPDEPIVSAYTRRATATTYCSAKTVANPRFIRAITNVHTFSYWTGEALDLSCRTLNEGRQSPIFEPLRYNHYWSRSIEDLRIKVERGDASSEKVRDLDWHLDFEAKLNEVEDRAIAPIAASIGLTAARLLT
ncbi:glycosyltransferase family 92 protein [uncultured Enterovirga sp.]|uniref:glycosyltransferase family 92 protein n=1 Tax=uncultured Enterovirga sp. TaxID=2026352 RepID=UPI0035CA9933